MLNPLPNQGLEANFTEYLPLHLRNRDDRFLDPLNQNVIRSDGLSRLLAHADAQPRSPKAVFSHTAGGRERASGSTTIRPRKRCVPISEIDLLESGVRSLIALADLPSLTPTSKQLIEEFRLPDPDCEPEMYRLYGYPWNRKLLVLWGCERHAGSSLPPLEAVSRLRSSSQPNWWIWLVRLLWLGALVALLAFLLWLFTKPAIDAVPPPVSPGGTSSDGTSSDGTSSGGTSSGGTSTSSTSSGGTSSGGTSSGGTSSGNTSSGKTSSGKTTSGKTTSGKTTSGKTTSGNTTSGNTTSGNTTSGNTTSGNTTTGNTTTKKTPAATVPEKLVLQKFSEDKPTGNTQQFILRAFLDSDRSVALKNVEWTVDGTSQRTPGNERQLTLPNGDYDIEVTASHQNQPLKTKAKLQVRINQTGSVKLIPIE